MKRNLLGTYLSSAVLLLGLWTQASVAYAQSAEEQPEPAVGQKVFVLDENGLSSNPVEEDGQVTIPFGTVLTIEEIGPNRFTVRHEGQAVYVDQDNMFQLQTALEFVQSKIDEDDTNVEWHAMKTHVLYSLRNFPEAIAASDKALAIDDKHVKSLHYRASSLFFANKVDESAELIEQLVEIAPDHYLTHAINFYLFNARGESEAGIEAMEKAVELNPYSGPLWCNLGFAFWQIGEFEQAYEYYEKAIEVAPVSPGGYQMYGICAYGQQDLENAKKYLNKAMEFNCPRLQTYQTLALFAEEDGQHEQYLKIIKRATQCKDCDDQTKNFYAWEMATSPQKAGRDAEAALEIAEQLVEAGQNEPELLANCLQTQAAAFGQLGRFMEALETLELVNPDSRTDLHSEMKSRFEDEEAYIAPPKDESEPAVDW